MGSATKFNSASGVVGGSDGAGGVASGADDGSEEGIDGGSGVTDGAQPVIIKNRTRVSTTSTETKLRLPKNILYPPNVSLPPAYPHPFWLSRTTNH